MEIRAVKRVSKPRGKGIQKRALSRHGAAERFIEGELILAKPGEQKERVSFRREREPKQDQSQAKGKKEGGDERGIGALRKAQKSRAQAGREAALGIRES